MIAVLQRVTSASVTAGGDVVGRVGAGLLVLLGVARGDTAAEADSLAHRVAGCRCFPNEDGTRSMERSARELGLGVLVVSQFTLCADTGKGMRPGFGRAAPPEVAEGLYDRFVAALRGEGIGQVATGRFGANMQVALVGDGPVTLILERTPGA